jgi:hypothetical protein
MRFRPYSLLPVSVVVVGCSFFTLDGPEETEPGTMTAGKGGMNGTGGNGGASGGTGGATGGSAGSAGGGAGTVVMAGMGGSSGNSGAGGGAGLGGAGGLSAGTGGASGASGAGAGGATGGTAGGAGLAGTAGGGAGGGGPCATRNAQAQAFGGHCYYRSTTPVTWSAAKTACEALPDGAHLVTITSQEEQTFVWNLAAMTDVWIGATDGKMENEPGEMSTLSTWITGEDIMMFNGWASGEPNNYQKPCSSGSGDCWEHCGFMWVDTQGAWNDDICGYEKAYVCEWDSGG